MLRPLESVVMYDIEDDDQDGFIAREDDRLLQTSRKNALARCNCCRVLLSLALLGASLCAVLIVLLRGTEPSESNIVILGDWGSRGLPAQRAVAGALDRYCGKFACDVIVSIGDNFYGNLTSLNDSMLDATYLSVYSERLLDKEWWISLGNHDHWYSRYQVQLQYATTNPKWYLPHAFYARDAEFQDFTVKHIVLDTSLLLPVTGNDALYTSDLPTLNETLRPLEWLEKQLNDSIASSVDWIIVYGHHPMLSSSGSGDNIVLQELLLPLFIRYNVHLYVSGHEHDLQYLEKNISMVNDNSSYVLRQVISGSGSLVQFDYNSTYTNTVFHIADYGFAQLKLVSESILLRFVLYNGTIPFDRTIVTR